MHAFGRWSKQTICFQSWWFYYWKHILFCKSFSDQSTFYNFNHKKFIKPKRSQLLNQKYHEEIYNLVHVCIFRKNARPKRQDNGSSTSNHIVHTNLASSLDWQQSQSRYTPLVEVNQAIKACVSLDNHSVSRSRIPQKKPRNGHHWHPKSLELQAKHPRIQNQNNNINVLLCSLPQKHIHKTNFLRQATEDFPGLPMWLLQAPPIDSETIIRPAITYCRPLSSLSPGMMRLIDRGKKGWVGWSQRDLISVSVPL